MGPPLPLVEGVDPVEVAFERLQSASAVVVSHEGRTLGVLTRSDLLEFLAHRRSQT
jgi:predicted transcriptional regulator